MYNQLKDGVLVRPAVIATPVYPVSITSRRPTASGDRSPFSFAIDERRDVSPQHPEATPHPALAITIRNPSAINAARVEFRFFATASALARIIPLPPRAAGLRVV